MHKFYFIFASLWGLKSGRRELGYCSALLSNFLYLFFSMLVLSPKISRVKIKINIVRGSTFWVEYVTIIKFIFCLFYSYLCNKIRLSWYLEQLLNLKKDRKLKHSNSEQWKIFQDLQFPFGIPKSQANYRHSPRGLSLVW